MYTLADIIAPETHYGRLIVCFLLSTMHGELPNSLPCHRLDAARLLVKLGFQPGPDEMDAFAARYAAYLTRRNAENPDHPIDFNLIQPNLNLQHSIPPARGP